MWIYRRMGKIVWPEKKTNNEVLKQLKLKRELFNTVRKRQMNFFGNIKRHNSILKDI
jgi:preprotein translocase subunit SecE